MDAFDALTLGFGVSLTPQNLLFCLLGTILGTAIGVLPGLGPTATISLLLPVTYHMPPVSAIRSRPKLKVLVGSVMTTFPPPSFTEPKSSEAPEPQL